MKTTDRDVEPWRLELKACNDFVVVPHFQVGTPKSKKSDVKPFLAHKELVAES